MTNDPANLERRRLVAEEAARAAGAVHLRYRSAGIEFSMKNENRRDLVTVADTEAEEVARAIIEAAFPGEAIVGEEDGSSREKAAEALGRACWVIDPLDGTFNFVHGYPDFSSTVAYVEAGQPLAGCVYASVFDEMFSAARGQGVTLNGVPITVSDRRGLANAIVNLSMSPLSDEAFMQKTLAVRKHAFSQKGFGGTALVLAYLAAGRYDLFYSAPNPRVGPWDVAAGALLVEEAGGVVRHIDGGEFGLPARDMAAGADASTLDELLALLED